MGSGGFFVDPFGDVLACNGMDKKMSMGNLNTQNWDEIWNSSQADKVRQSVKKCNKNCWMIGSAAPAMWQNLKVPVMWIVRNKLRLMLAKEVI
jgi:MoaA/NifB/PqqE/SkfB family radical SAM enzyme